MQQEITKIGKSTQKNHKLRLCRSLGYSLNSIDNFTAIHPVKSCLHPIFEPIAAQGVYDKQNAFLMSNGAE